MKRNDNTKGIADHNQTMWDKLPGAGQFVKALDINGLVDTRAAILDSQTYLIGPTTTPMPTPTPTPKPAAPETEARSPNPEGSSGRYVDEVSGIGPQFTRRLIKGGIGSLPTLASAAATDVAQILSVSEVRAMGFIDDAGRLLQN